VRRSAVAGIVALVLLVGLGGYTAGLYRNGSGPATGTTGTSPDRAATASPTTIAPSTTGSPQPQPVRSPGATQAQPAANPFWDIISETRRAAGPDTGTQAELLRDRVSKLRPAEILAFDRWWKSLDRSLYTWQVWGAAFVVQDGCADDCFRDFRAYLISLGPDAVRAATQSPDALAPMVNNSDIGDWSGAKNVAPDAFRMATDSDFPGDTSDLSGTPRGVRWSDNQVPALLRQYPRLTSKFR
jgi:hypothetical protein